MIRRCKTFETSRIKSKKMKPSGNLQKEVDGKQRDVTESISNLQSELQALQQETTDKHKTYEDSIQFFFTKQERIHQMRLRTRELSIHNKKNIRTSMCVMF